MIREARGSRPKVTGNKRAIVVEAPIPGMMPTTVPMTTPRKRNKRFSGCTATANPWRTCPRVSINPFHP
jgi:hypothetical protein